jgi:hypothetical protein
MTSPTTLTATWSSYRGGAKDNYLDKMGVEEDKSRKLKYNVKIPPNNGRDLR